MHISISFHLVFSHIFFYLIVAGSWNNFSYLNVIGIILYFYVKNTIYNLKMLIAKILF